MGRYLIQAAYTPEAWAAMVASPRDRSTPVRAMVERVGGTLEAFYLTFGEYDVVSIVQLPDDVAAAAVSMAASAGGGLRAIRTTTLLAVPEALDHGPDRRAPISWAGDHRRPRLRRVRRLNQVSAHGNLLGGGPIVSPSSRVDMMGGWIRTSSNGSRCTARTSRG